MDPQYDLVVMYCDMTLFSIGTIDNEEFSTALRDCIKPAKPVDVEQLKREFNWVDMSGDVSKELEFLEMEQKSLDSLCQKLSVLVPAVYRT
jgi:hypothetical protein